MEDEEASNGLIFADFIPTVKCNIDNSFLISQFLAADGYDHVDIVYNLHSGIHPAVLKLHKMAWPYLFIMHCAQVSMTWVHSLNWSRKMLSWKMITTMMWDSGICRRLLAKWKARAQWFMLKKTIGFPFPCQQVPCLQGAIKTPQGELMLFLELCTMHQTVHDNKISFVIEPHKKPKFYKHDEH